jgi:hypothetical protein
MFAFGMLAFVLPTTSAFADPPQPEWTLFSPITSTTTYLIDLNGVVQHTWPSAYRPGQAVYLLDAGGLLRTCNDMSVGGWNAGGRGGRLQRLAWDGTVEWNYPLIDANKCQHHDAIVLPNGNVLAIVWEKKTVAEAVAVGRNPATLGAGELWSEMLLEIQSIGATGGTIVWEWHAWDHLVQNFDATKPNFAPPSSRPERININYGALMGSAEWLHINGLDYNESLDQVVMSVHNFDEIWIISRAPAASGDLLYRWGNPVTYGHGTAADQKLFGQHNARWIADGQSGAGDILLYNNGLGRPQGAYSSVEQIHPPLLPNGTYAYQTGQAYGPSAPVWSCVSASGAQFYSSNISGAQRLSNGNTLVCVGSSGRFIELDSACEIVWEYVNPFVGGMGSNAVFRATRIESDDPRLAGILFCAAGALLADTNDDGLRNGGDIRAFVEVFLAGSSGPPSTPRCAADMNGDGNVDEADLSLFVATLFEA